MAREDRGFRAGWRSNRGHKSHALSIYERLKAGEVFRKRIYLGPLYFIEYEVDPWTGRQLRDGTITHRYNREILKRSVERHYNIKEGNQPEWKPN